jgi:hypothetical protein
MGAAIFQDSGTNAIAAGRNAVQGSAVLGQVAVKYFGLAGVSVSTTYAVRAGQNGAATISVNGVSGAQVWGGALQSGIWAKEIMV